MTGQHERNTRPMRASPRCGAKTRTGKPCQSPIVRGRKRCRMHGGARGSGARPGNRNALKHGFYGAEAVAERRRIRALMADLETQLASLEEGAGGQRTGGSVGGNVVGREALGGMFSGGETGTMPGSPGSVIARGLGCSDVAGPGWELYGAVGPALARPIPGGDGRDGRGPRPGLGPGAEDKARRPP